MIKKILITIFLLLFSFANSATLDEKIGQMLIVGFNGNDIESKGFKKIYKQLKKGDISGVIIFNRNIKSKKDLIKMNEQILSSNLKNRPFISIDNEGGKIQRFPDDGEFHLTKSAQEVSKMTENEARNEYKKMVELEKELKINFNFAPCIDLAINKNSIIIKKNRSYGINADDVSKYAAIFIDEHNKNNILTSIKHFPGHGSISTDTHKSFADATNTFKKEELLPYINLKNKYKFNTVMVSHIFNSEFDDKYPASLSEKTIKYLKNNIGFDGLIVSDDYDMGAIKNNYSLDDTIKLAINSGINILIFSNNIDGFDKKIVDKIHKSIKKQVKTGEIDIKNIDSSYEKIIKLKKNFK